MLKVITGALFAVIFVLSLHYSGMITFDFLSSQEESVSWESKQVPELPLQKLDGSSFELKEFQGKIVLLNFWASWCAPCIEEFPSLLRLVENYKGELILLAISTDEHKKDVHDFLARFQKKHPKAFKQNGIHIAWDPKSEIAQGQFNVIRYPETIILDKNQKMVRKIVGIANWDGTELTKYLASLQ